MREEEIYQSREALAEDSEEGFDGSDGKEMVEIIEDIYDGLRPLELNLDDCYVQRIGSNGVVIWECCVKNLSIEVLVNKGLIIPGPWQIKVEAGLFDARLHDLTEEGMLLARLLQS